jgi:hypothetical protein
MAGTLDVLNHERVHGMVEEHHLGKYLKHPEDDEDFVRDLANADLHFIVKNESFIKTLLNQKNWLVSKK